MALHEHDRARHGFVDAVGEIVLGLAAGDVEVAARGHRAARGVVAPLLREGGGRGGAEREQQRRGGAPHAAARGAAAASQPSDAAKSRMRPSAARILSSEFA